MSILLIPRIKESIRRGAVNLVNLRSIDFDNDYLPEFIVDICNKTEITSCGDISIKTVATLCDLYDSESLAGHSSSFSVPCFPADAIDKLAVKIEQTVLDCLKATSRHDW